MLSPFVKRVQKSLPEGVRVRERVWSGLLGPCLFPGRRNFNDPFCVIF